VQQWTGAVEVLAEALTMYRCAGRGQPKVEASAEAGAVVDGRWALIWQGRCFFFNL
jgi:hypothetical protein